MHALALREPAEDMHQQNLLRKTAKLKSEFEEAAGMRKRFDGSNIFKKRLSLMNEAETSEQRNNKEQQDNGARNG